MWREALDASHRVREFLRRMQRLRTGDEVEVRGFLVLRKPPNAPSDAVYYLLSPLSPSELKESGIKPYAVLRVTPYTNVSERLRSGDYVSVRGIADSYPLGNMRMLHVIEIRGQDYSHYWESFEGMALSGREIEGLIRDTIYANRQLEDTIVYSLFGSPFTLLSPDWGEGVVLSAIKDSTGIVKPLWLGLRYLTRLFPRELLLRKDGRIDVVDEELDLDFRLHLPESPVRYYVPGSVKLLRGGGVPKWVERRFLRKEAVFLTPGVGRADPTAELPTLSEAPFLLTERVGFERNGELERLAGNLVASIFIQRSRLGALSNESVGYYRRKFEEWLRRERSEYGEKFDALRLSGRVFDTGLRMRLGLRLMGAMARLEGRERRIFVSRVMAINTEIVDLWMNELPPALIMRLVEDYERYVSGDRRANEALRIFMDMSTTRENGEVTRNEFLRALMEYGFRRRDALELIEKLLSAGYVYEPFPGRLKLVDV